MHFRQEHKDTSEKRPSTPLPLGRLGTCPRKANPLQLFAWEQVECATCHRHRFPTMSAFEQTQGLAAVPAVVQSRRFWVKVAWAWILPLEAKSIAYNVLIAAHKHNILWFWVKMATIARWKWRTQ